MCKVTVEQEDVGTINYKEESYTCDIGQEISTTITAEGPNDKIATIKSYSSNNTNIATIEKDLENDIKCVNCIAVKIKCKNSGTVTLTATSSEGVTTKVSMTVNDK